MCSYSQKRQYRLDFESGMRIQVNWSQLALKITKTAYIRQWRVCRVVLVDCLGSGYSKSRSLGFTVFSCLGFSALVVLFCLWCCSWWFWCMPVSENRYPKGKQKVAESDRSVVTRWSRPICLGNQRMGTQVEGLGVASSKQLVAQGKPRCDW